MDGKPRLHLHAILLRNLIITLRRRACARLNHPPNRAGDERNKRKVRRGQNGTISIPVAHIACLESGMAFEITARQGAGDGAGQAEAADDDVALLDHWRPVVGEGFAGRAALGLQEGEHLRVLVQCQPDGGRGAAQREDEAEMGRLW